jgi:hypothetical protein
MPKIKVRTAGYYIYSRPEWNHVKTVQVIVDENTLALSVVFRNGAWSVPMTDIPDDATFFYQNPNMED